MGANKIRPKYNLMSGLELRRRLRMYAALPRRWGLYLSPSQT